MLCVCVVLARLWPYGESLVVMRETAAPNLKDVCYLQSMRGWKSAAPASFRPETSNATEWGEEESSHDDAQVGESHNRHVIQFRAA